MIHDAREIAIDRIKREADALGGIVGGDRASPYETAGIALADAVGTADVHQFVANVFDPR